MSRAPFTLRTSVHENVAELRRVLGSVEKPLPLGGLARVLNEEDGRSRNASTIQRWEEGAEPDLASIRIMAAIAGVSFEDFALGVPEVRQSEGGDPVDVDRVPGRRRKPA